MSSNRICSRCLQSQPSSNYIKNVDSITFFKTCSTCRNRDKARRRNTLQRSPFEPSILQADVTEPSTNNQVIVVNDIPNNQYHDNENLMNENTTSINFVHCKGCRKNRHPNFFYDLPQNKTYKQCSDCRHRKFVRRNPLSMQTRSVALPQSNDNLFESVENYSIIDEGPELIMVTCTKCKRSCPSNLFTDSTTNVSYRTCFNCRSMEHSRRFPTVFEPISIQRPDENIEDIYDASDEEVHQLAANIGMFEIVEEEVFNGPVPEEAPMGDDPIFMFSQRQSREFRNHDEIQRRLQINEEENDIINVSETDPNIDPFLDEIPQPAIDNDIQVENLVPNDPSVEENPHPRNNEIGQSQSLQQLDPFLESNPPPQAEGV